MKRYEPDPGQDARMLECADGTYVHHSQATALLQLADDKLQRAERERLKAERQLADVTAERDRWMQIALQAEANRKC